MTVPSVQDPAPVSTGPYGAMVDAEAAAIAQIQQNLTAAVLALWSSFSAFYVGESVAQLARQVATLVVASQRQVGLITEQYLRQQFRQMGSPLPTGRIVDLPRDLRLGTETEEVYQRPVRQVRYLASRDVPLQESVRQATERLEKALEADIQNAHTTASQQVFYTPTSVKVAGYRRILHPERANYGPVCGLCIVAADRVYSRIEKMATHPGCVAEGSYVSADGVRALTRRWYAGPLVVLRTRSGQELRVTPNHPVLTDQGWVSAGRLQQGDRVVRGSGSQRVRGGGPDEQQTPVRVEDLWRTAVVAGGLRPSAVPLTPEDLHGDGGHGEVDVVLVDRHLAPIGDVTFVEPCSELGLVDAHAGRVRLAAEGALSLLLRRLDTSSGSVVGALRQSEAVLASCLAVANSGPAGSPAQRDAGLAEPAFDDWAAGIELGSQLEASGTFEVPAGNGSSVDLQTRPTRFDPTGSEMTAEGRESHAVLGRQLVARLAGEVELDEVVDQITVEFAGHVFNLETSEGWYVSDSIAVSNCRCTTLPILVSSDGETVDPGRSLNAEDLLRLYDAAGSTKGRDLAQLRVTTKENGELGPILMADGTEFKQTDDVLDQLSDRAREQRKNSINRQIAALEAVPNRNEWLEDRLAQLHTLALTA